MITPLLHSRGPIKLLFMELDEIRQDRTILSESIAKIPQATTPSTVVADDTDVAGRLGRIEEMLQTLCSAARERKEERDRKGVRTEASPSAESVSAEPVRGATRNRRRRNASLTETFANGSSQNQIYKYTEL